MTPALIHTRFSRREGLAQLLLATLPTICNGVILARLLQYWYATAILTIDS